MTAVTMLLECTASNQIRCWCKLDRAKAKCYLMDVGKRLHDLYDKVCCHQGRSLMLRSHKRKRTGAFPNPTMNPMMRRGSRQQWQHLVDDVKTGAWQNMCQSAAVLIEESIGSNGIKVCYKTLFDIMARFDSTLLLCQLDGICLALQHRPFHSNFYVCHGLAFRSIVC